MRSRVFEMFHLAGFSHYDGVDVFQEFKIGTELELKAEPENRHDSNAVEIYYKDRKIGYVPRCNNKQMSLFLRLGHTNLFETHINRIVEDADPEHQVSVVVRVREAGKNAKK